MTYRKTIKAAVRCVIFGIADGDMWGDIRAGLTSLAILILRILILITFPISVLLIAWLIAKDERLTAVQNEDARKRMKSNIHRNGAP